MSIVNQNSEIDTTFTNHKNTYLDHTHRLNDYNEIYNLNSYLSNATHNDLERIQSINNTIKTRVMQAKQEYMMYEHGASQYRFRVNLLYFLLICVSLVLFCVTMHSEQRLDLKWTIIITSTILIVCLITIWVAVIANKARRNYAYNQFYWQEAKQVKK